MRSAAWLRLLRSGLPYDARFINHETGKADKCTFCAHRLQAGLLPACVETCVAARGYSVI